ncbi:hypothetical protein ACH347_07670 [Saccharopolyspora sp. 5N102]|uniref:hypothetical protein n=1 Tax=Saccharopolyspora sp. 5N102 TaxID=3375155 RepID=UPI00378D03B1
MPGQLLLLDEAHGGRILKNEVNLLLSAAALTRLRRGLVEAYAWPVDSCARNQSGVLSSVRG